MVLNFYGQIIVDGIGILQEFWLEVAELWIYLLPTKNLLIYFSNTTVNNKVVTTLVRFLGYN